jgi:hypothetical protein
VSRIVNLQDRQINEAHWSLSAIIGDNGDFSIEGQIVGQVLGNDEWEHEWVLRVQSGAISSLLALLGGEPDQDLLDIVERKWLPVEGAGLEKLIVESDVPNTLDVWDRPA